MKKIILFHAITVLLGNLLWAQTGGYTDGIVAIVNDEIITVYDVALFNSSSEKQIHQQYKREDLRNETKRQQLFNEINSNRIKAANELINHKLVYAEFKKKGYQLPNELVDKRLDSIVAANAGGDWSKFEEMLRGNDMTLDMFREQIERNLKVDLLISQMVDRSINISPEQIEDYYNQNEEELEVPAKILLQLIEIKKDAFTAADYQQRLMEVSDGIERGEKFSTLARQYSTHSSKENGGELGWLKETDMRAEFRSGLDTIEKGKTSAALTIDGNTYFVHIADVEDNNSQSVEEVYKRVKNKLFREERQKRYETYVNDLRNQAYVRVFFKE